MKLTKRPAVMASLILLSVVLLPSCTSVPATRTERTELRDDARAALATMEGRDPGLKAVLDQCAGYAVFPNVGKGGFVVGGAFGHGAVYRRGGALDGYAKVTQVSVGGVVGARLSSILLVFETESDLARFKSGDELSFGAEATAVAVTEGSSATTRFHNGVAVFAVPKGGLMADASLSGQGFRYVSGGDVGDDDVSGSATAAVPQDDED